jgi:hypothetical protein
MLKIRDRLQAVEDELVEAGFDEFIVATGAGTFVWRTTRTRGRSTARSRRQLATHESG